jgi:hypothetical protein
MPTDAEARLAEIRRQIAEGTYETSENIEAAVEKMLERWAQDQDDPDSPRVPRTAK